MPTPPPPPAGESPTPGSPRPRPYGSVRLAAPVAAVPPPAGTRAAAAGHWPYGSVRLPLLSIAALRAGRRRSG
ncbi:hypothetical protein [Streptomyces sp. NPDC020983]|uniref:hypothetical protein n=1 Tax=Streptomyces sp. NPDC020983 TaxID=3365106 RepID=UPI00378FF6E8